MKTYKHSNGHLVHRTSGGRFRKTTFADMGIYDANEKGQVFICNVCEREFIPLVLSGTCCGADNKRLKEIVYTPEELELMNQIEAIRKKPFINRQDVEDTQNLERELHWLRQRQKKSDSPIPTEREQ